MLFESRKLGPTLLAAVSAMLIGAATAPQVHAAEADVLAKDETLGEIVVTARRRNESIQTTPVAVTSVSVADLESKAAVNIGDLQGQVPNLLITNQNSGAAAANLAIRGLAFADVEKSFDPTVAVVVDGVFIGTSTGQFLDFFDLGSIEVLRGPQGTLFGRNTIGGVINIKRTDPTGEWGVKTELSYGRFNTLTGRGVFNMPIGEVLAAKFFYFGSKTDGWNRDYRSGDYVGGTTNQNYGAALKFAPKDSSFTALLTLERERQVFEPVISNITKTGELFATYELPIAVNRNTQEDLYTVFGTPLSHGTYDAPAVTLNMNWKTGPVDWTSVTGYRRSKENQWQDYDAAGEVMQPGTEAITPMYWINRLQNYHQFSQELRAAGKLTDALDYVAGLYYFDSWFGITQRTWFFNSEVPYHRAEEQSKSAAGFVDFDWQIAPQWRASFGGRYTRDTRDFYNYQGMLLGTPSASFNKFTPKVGIDWRPTQDVMVYASYSVGYRSGGFSSRAGTVYSTNKRFEPETVDSSEIGIKTSWLENRLSMNLAAFNSKYKDMQQNTTVSGGSDGNQTIVSNVGSATVRGIEFELTARPISRLTVNMSVATLHSRFSNFIVTAPDTSTDPAFAGSLATYDYSNNNLIYNPKIQTAMSVDWAQPTSWGEERFHIGWRHIDEYDQQISDAGDVLAGTFTDSLGVHHRYIVQGNDPRVTAAPQDIVDAALTSYFKLGKGRAKFAIYGRNLTNDLGPTHAFTVAGLWSFATSREPRTYGVTLGYDF